MIRDSGSVKFVCALSSGVGSIGAGSLPRCRRPSASPGSFLVTATLLFFRLGARPRFPGVPSPPESWPAAAPPLQFVGQFIATTASQRRPARRRACSACSSNLFNLPSQALDFLGHIAVARRLVPRGVRSHLGTVGRQVPQLDHAQRARPVAALPGTGAEMPPGGSLRKSLIVRKSGGSLPTMARKARLRLARRRDLARNSSRTTRRSRRRAAG